jgi:alkanesulfonate monooxygenase SsuD/methylene tetrahydromethanopterin reductase-like flavin-dependent oxidoreductase (luciferase family)
MVEAWTAAGTPDECAAHLRALVAAGAKSIALRITSWDQPGNFARLVADVIPRVLA